MSIRHLAPLLAVLLVTAGPLGGCRRAVNPVADYLDNAELQYETEAQKQNIMRALNDVLTLSGQELAGRRYEDYTGKADEWDLPTLIYRHFVPDRKGKTLGSRFYTDAASARVQAQVRRILDRLTGADTTKR